MVILLEIFVCIKHTEGGVNLVERKTPVYIWLTWGIIYTAIIIYWIYLLLKKDATTLYTGNEIKKIETSGRPTPRGFKNK
jgi:hypothetical protein